MKNIILSIICTLACFLPLKFIPGDKSPPPGEHEIPADWFIAQRLYPYGKPDYTAYKEAVIQRAVLLSKDNERDLNAWKPEGPINIGGRIQDIEMDPGNTSIIYAGAASGGIFKSIDDGQSWLPIFDAQPSLSIGDIAIAPSDPNIIFAGTGEPNCGGGSITYDGMGIYKSADAGESWTYSALDSTRNTGRIVVDPKNTDRVFAATIGDLFANGPQRGVYRTLDGGASWEQVLFITDSTGAIDLAINPLHPDTIFACMWERIRRPTYEHYGGASCGIYRSYDGGDSWTLLSSGLPTGVNLGRIGIDISASDPNTLYAIYADKTGFFNGVFKTTNNGDSWAQTNDNGLGNIFASYGWWFGRIKVDPSDPNIVFAIGFDEFKTTDGGNSWDFSGGSMHVDHHTMFIHPLDHNIIFNGNDGGVYKSTDGGSSWTHFLNIPNSQFYTCEIDNNNTNRLYGGLQDNGVVRTLSGAVNDWSGIIGGDGFYVLVDPTNSNYIYGESQYGALLRSTNGGISFLGATAGISNNDRKNWNTPIVFNPQNTKSLYCGTNKLYKTVNRAVNWTAISGDLTNGSGGGNITFGTVTTIAVSPVDTNIIYAGTDDGNVSVTTNNGANWTNVSASLPDRWVTRLTCDPSDASKAYVTFSGYRFNDDMVHVYMTENAGQSWQSISGNLPDVPVNDILRDPVYDSLLYAATDVGVFISNDLGNNWDILGDSLPIVPVTDLTLNAPAKLLVAATYGRSMYSLALNNFPTTAGTVFHESVTLEIFPNPVKDLLNAVFISSENTKGKIACTDGEGKMIFEKEYFFKSGKNSLQITTRYGYQRLRPGIYFLKLEAGDQSAVQKFIVL
jgi:photosystem II stability/assembly factor-like uncharacterized protein